MENLVLCILHLRQIFRRVLPIWWFLARNLGKEYEPRAMGILEEMVISQEQTNKTLFVNSGFIFYIKYGVLNKCYLLQKHWIISGDVPELSFHSNISAQYTCWVMNFILAHSPYLTFKRPKKSQPKPQKGTYYMIFSLTLLDKERLKAILSVTKEIWFDSSSVKDCRKSNKFNAKNDINKVVRLGGSVYSAFPECQCRGWVLFVHLKKKIK